MYLPTLLALSSSVLLAGNASVLFSTRDPTATFRPFSFAAKATTTNNADKGSSDNRTLQNDANMQYIGNVNVGGHDFTLIVDTGSSDLWVTARSKLKLNSTTDTTVNLTYGIGSAYGNIAYAPVSFGGYSVDNQAFLSVSKSYDQDEAEGILGLGLNGLSALERKTKNTSTRSIMANVFSQHPSTPHLIGLALERSDNGEETAGGYFTIGEYDPNFTNVTYTPKVPVTSSSGRWTIAMEAITINGKRHPLKSTVQGTKKGQAIALIDSGTSLAYVPNDAVDAIYSQYAGGVHVKTADQDAWFVPCLEQVNLSFTFAGIAYPINPMELSSPTRVIDRNNQYTVCIGAFRPTLSGTEHELDFLLGDIFMRNVYSVFNFGNVSTKHDGSENASADTKSASIQLLSRTNQDQVFSDFGTSRKMSLRPYPPLFDLAKLHNDGSTDGGGRLAPPPAD